MGIKNLEPSHEYCSPADGAWYDVQLVFRSNILTVTYCNLSELFDELYLAGDFESLEAVDDFEKRFRPVSLQFQDSECKKIIKGIAVSASSLFGEERRFYDACVEDVKYMDHSFVNGEEVCSCRFELRWKHGPNAWKLSVSSIENICQILPNQQVDPKLAAFLDKSREVVKNSLVKSGEITVQKKTCQSNAKLKSRPLGKKRATKSLRAILSKLTTAGVLEDQENREQDVDLGGNMLLLEKCKETEYYYIVIENLEKDIFPSTIMNFIHKQTNITAQAYVFPCSSSETYTRGAIVTDCKEKLEKLCAFLDNPDLIMVTSSRGRPWVITEKFLHLCTYRTSIKTIMSSSQNTVVNSIAVCDELKVVYSGTKEYKTAKQLRDLFIDFADHQKRLHQRLAFEERKISSLMNQCKNFCGW